MSPVIQKGFILFLSKMSKIAGCNGGPTSRQSFNDGTVGFALLSNHTLSSSL